MIALRQLILVAVLLFAVRPCAAQLQPRVVALYDQAAPGTNEIFEEFGAPTISSTSEVAFYAGLKWAGNSALAAGIWTDTAGTLEFIARKGTVPDGYPAGSGFRFTSSGVHSTRSPIALSGGEVSFEALLNNQGGGTWLGTTTTDPVAGVWTGQPAPTNSPGTVFQGSVLNSLRTSQSGNSVTIAALQTGVGGATSSTAAGIWTGMPGNLDLVARQGSSAPSTAGTFSAFQFPVLNENGVTAFAAGLSVGGAVTSTNNSGVWSGTSDNLQLLAREGDIAPGTGGQAFSSFIQVSINNPGTVVFSGQTVPSNGYGLWRSDGGVLDLIAASGQSMPGIEGDFHLVGTSASVINGNGTVAFQAFFQGADVGTNRGQSLWVDDGGELRMLAMVGDAVPGTNGNITFDGEFIPFLNDSGYVAFCTSVRLQNQHSIGGGGLFVYDLQGNLVQSILAGDQIEVAPGNVRTVTGLALPYTIDNSDHTLWVGGGQDGRPSPLNNRNELAFRASFGLYDEGVFVLTVPEPSSAILGGVGGLAFVVASWLGRQRRRSAS